MEQIGENKFMKKFKKFTNMIKKIKLTLPLAIVLVAIILGGAFYAIQVNKQKSIERQQEIKLQEDRLLEETKAEQVKKEYVADRKNDCLDIYKAEDDKWNNIQGWRYNEAKDKCLIRYKDPNPKSDAECDKNWPTGGDSGLYWWLENSLCKDGEFENSF